MATITQRLAFLISANADGAIKAFDKTAQQADKQLGKAQKNIDRLGASMTRFGATGLAAAGTLGAGLFRLAQGAIDDQKAQALLAEQLRSSTGATEAQIKAVEQNIDAMARATGVADDQLRPALGNLIRATGDTAKAQQLLQTSMDISAATGRDLEAVTIAMGRAANGQISSLSRLGIPLSENVKKSKDFDAALQALNQQFGGAAAVAADTYAGKMARAQVAISEAGESLGSAFIPVIEKAASIVTKGAQAFDAFNRTTGGLGSTLATVGVVGLGTLSTLSLIGGQAIKLRDSFFKLDAETKKMTGSLTALGKMTVIGTAAIAAGVVVYQAYASKKAEAEARTLALADALKLEGAAQKAALEETVKADDTAKTHNDTLLKLGLTWDTVGRSAQGHKTDIDDIRKAYEKYTARGQFTIDRARELGEAIGYQGEVTPGVANKIGNLISQIDALTDANLQAAKSTDVATDALGRGYTEAMMRGEAYQKNVKEFVDQRAQDKYNAIVKARQDAVNKSVETGTARTKENTAETKRAAEAKARFAKKVEDAAGALRDKLGEALDSAKTKLKEATDDYNQYIGTVSQAIAGTVNLGNAQSTAVSNAESLAQAQQAVTDAQKEYNTALQSRDPEKAAEAYTKLKDAQKALNAESAKPQGFLAVLKEQADAAVQFGTNLDKLLASNLSPEAYAQLVSAGAEAGNAIATELLSGADPASKINEVNRLVASTQALADRVAKAAADKFRAAGVAQATALVEGMQSVFDTWSPKLSEGAVGNLATPVKTLVDYGAQVDAAIVAATTGMAVAAPVVGKKKKRKIPKLADGGIVQSEPGGRLVLLGEGGRDEAVVPLPAAGLLGGGATFNITVNAGLGVNGSQVGKEIVDVLVEYQRRVGALPIKVNG